MTSVLPLTDAAPEAFMRVAIVEDDADLLTVVCQVLEAEGHVAIPFDHVDALTGPLINQTHPDVLLTDVQIPGDGFGLADEFMKRPHPPIIFIIGPDEPVDAQAHGAVGVLHKPFTPDELLQTINDVAAAKRPWRKPLRIQR